MTSQPIIAWLGHLGHSSQPRLPLAADQRAALDYWLAHRAALPAFVRTCPSAQHYLQLLGPLAWAERPQYRNPPDCEGFQSP